MPDSPEHDNAAVLNQSVLPGGFQTEALRANFRLFGRLGLRTLALASPLLLTSGNSQGARWLGALGTVGLAAILIGRTTERHTSLEPRLPGLTEANTVILAEESVYYEVGGEGPPVVLLHPIGGGASSNLWRENTAALARSHRVYAFDWPGFARSGARPNAYTNDLYTRVLTQFLREVVRDPAALIAVSYGADYAIRVAAETPDLVTSLLLVGPTGYGFDRKSREARPGLFRRVSERNEKLFRAFSSTPLGHLAYSALRSETGFDFFQRNYVYLDPRRATKELTDIGRDNLTGPFKGYAPWSFFSGLLDQPTTDLWPRTAQPAVLVWGARDLFTPVQQAHGLLSDRQVPLHILQARGLPFDECAPEFNRLALDFLKESS